MTVPVETPARGRPRLADPDPAAGDAGTQLALGIESVVAICAQQGHAVDTAYAERIATGAANAVRAVRELGAASLLETEPAHYRPELERLADSPDP